MNKLFFLLSLIATIGAFGQNRLVAWESSIALNYHLKEWKLNTSIGHRTTKIESMEGIKSSQLAFLDVNQFITRKINPKLALSAGYKYRSLNPTSNEKSYEQRLTQQVAYIHTNQRIRLLSRVRIEQRFFEDFFSHRYRYRFSLDMPLSGLQLDLKEFYFVASNEALLEFQESSSRFDNRISLGLGFVVSALYRFQVDYTHRIEGLNDTIDQIPFIHTSLIFNL
jgi:hypothetical protein